MITQDYLMRMLLVFFQALVRARSRALNDKDMEGAAEMLEKTVGDAANMDKDVLLSLSGDSLSGILGATGTDPKLTEFMARSLMQAAEYRDRAGQSDIADLRRSQAKAIADAYGHDLTIEMEDFLQKYDFSEQDLDES